MVKRTFFSIFCVTIVALLLMMGCAALQKPDKIIILNLAARNCGFLLAEENLPLALEIREYSKSVLAMANGEVGETTFHEWAVLVVERISLDPLLEINFKEMIKLVNIKIELIENQQEIMALAFSIIRNFIIGIEAGK